MANVKAGHHDLIQLPPDSTGKIAATFSYSHLPFSSGTAPFLRGELVEGGTSLAVGRILRVRGETAAGELLIDYQDGGYPVTGVPRFLSGENLQVGGITRAVLTETPTDVQTPLSMVASGDNALNRWNIDNQGAAYIRYTEGVPQLDAFGLARQTSPTLIAYYTNHYGIRNGDYSDYVVGSGAITHVPNSSSVQLFVG